MSETDPRADAPPLNWDDMGLSELPTGTVTLLLADVEGSTQLWHIPMREVPARLTELPPGRPLVVMCHGGSRSRRVAEFLAANGFEQVFNLHGGIDAWSQQIDPDIPRY